MQIRYFIQYISKTLPVFCQPLKKTIQLHPHIARRFWGINAAIKRDPKAENNAIIVSREAIPSSSREAYLSCSYIVCGLVPSFIVLSLVAVRPIFNLARYYLQISTAISSPMVSPVWASRALPMVAMSMSGTWATLLNLPLHLLHPLPITPHNIPYMSNPIEIKLQLIDLPQYIMKSCNLCIGYGNCVASSIILLLHHYLRLFREPI